MNEIQLQAECTTWFQNNMRNERGRFRRVKNETDLKGQAGIRMGALNKATGIVRGTWDSFFVVNPIVWIEFKVSAGVLSPEQREFAKMGIEAGWKFHVCRNLEDFINLTKIYF